MPLARGLTESLLLLLILAGCSSAAAQTIRASIYGHVFDPSGSSVPGATVKVVHVATNVEYRFVTDSLGNYDFPRLLQFGEYRLEVEAAGFHKLIVDGLSALVPERGSGGSGTAGVVYSPSSEATEEIKVLSNTFSAEYGKMSLRLTF